MAKKRLHPEKTISASVRVSATDIADAPLNRALDEKIARANVITDRKGTIFNPELHAATADGTPHVDSAGSFILKAHHYDGAKKAHFGDSFRHA